MRNLKSAGYTNLIMRTHAELDLTDQTATEAFFAQEKPDYVFLAAARVGGILANNSYPAEFIRDNLAIQTNIIHAAYKNNVTRLMFLGSSCIYPKLAPQPMKEDYLLSGLLEPTNAVLETRHTRRRPRTRQRLGVAQVRPEHCRSVIVLMICRGGKVWIDRGQIIDGRNQPRLGPVREERVRQQDHRGSVRDGDPHGLNCGVKAVARGQGGHDWQRCFTVTSVHCVQQVRLLNLGW